MSNEPDERLIRTSAINFFLILAYHKRISEANRLIEVLPSKIRNRVHKISLFFLDPLEYQGSESNEHQHFTALNVGIAAEFRRLLRTFDTGSLLSR